MSIISSTAEQICNSPTNLSKAKMLYSFPKSPRFYGNKENECFKFYDLNTKNQKRATTFGYGTKYDFTTDLPHTPSPGAYESTSAFQLAKKKNRGFVFGSGRVQTQSSGFAYTNSNPAPGAYQIGSNISNIRYSIKGKSKVDDRELIYVPGPGSCKNCLYKDEIPTHFNKTGFNYCSKYRNKSACKFGREQKHKYENRKVPGPGAYESIKTEFSPDGKYYYSKLQSVTHGKFDKAIRVTMESRCKTPGPGNYRLPSQFGYYINRNALRALGQHQKK